MAWSCRRHFSVRMLQPRKCFLENVCGAQVGRPAFDAFIAKYIKHFAFKSINTSQFLEFLKSHLPEAAAAVDLEAWVRGRGIPGDAPRPHSASLAVLKDAAAAVAAASAKSEEEQEAGIPRDVSKAWGAREWATFVKFLPRTLSPGMLELLDSTFHFSEVRTVPMVYRLTMCDTVLDRSSTTWKNFFLGSGTVLSCMGWSFEIIPCWILHSGPHLTAYAPFLCNRRTTWRLQRPSSPSQPDQGTRSRSQE